MSKRKKTTAASPPSATPEENESVTTRAVVPSEVMKAAIGGELAVEAEGAGEDAMRAPAATDPGMEDPVIEDAETSADSALAEPPASEEVDVPIDADEFDAEMTVNLAGDLPPGRDDLDAPTVTHAGNEQMEEVDRILVQRKHLRGLLEALVFASDSPIKTKELAKLASAQAKLVTDLLGELKTDFATRGIHLDEVAGGWVFRTSPQYAPFVRDLTKQKPVRLSRAQVETLAIIAYRQPITRPEVDDVRGVDSGPVLKLLLERDLVRILGKRDEPGRPLIYGTTGHFLEFFGLKSLKDLPTLREFTELSDESREAFEDELGEAPEDAALRAAAGEAHAADGAPEDLGAHEPGDEDHADRVSGAAIEGQLESMTDLEDDDEDADVAAERPTDSGVEPRDVEPRESSNGVASEPHASDDDGPTLTSEAPSSEDD